MRLITRRAVPILLALLISVGSSGCTVLLVGAAAGAGAGTAAVVMDQKKSDGSASEDPSNKPKQDELHEESIK
jgi:hypothetical protein